MIENARQSPAVTMSAGALLTLIGVAGWNQYKDPPVVPELATKQQVDDLVKRVDGFMALYLDTNRNVNQNSNTLSAHGAKIERNESDISELRGMIHRYYDPLEGTKP